MSKRPRPLSSSPPPTLHFLTSDFGSTSRPTLKQTLHVQAYEATIIQSQPEAAKRVETKDDGSLSGKGGGLIRWLPDDTREDDDEVWVDRFDARLLLTSRHTHPPPRSSSPPSHELVSTIGWSSLPADSEDAFFLSPSEIESFRADIARRELEDRRADRIRALEKEEAEENARLDQNDPRTWGGDDEEPSEAQLTLITRTALALSKSPNPRQLEMRILANHGSDARFAFLRGRWKHAWDKARGINGVKEKSGEGTGLVGMGDYSDSDEEENGNDEDEKLMDTEATVQDPGVSSDSGPTVSHPSEGNPALPAQPSSLGETTSDPATSSASVLSLDPVLTEAQAERRARAKLWAAQRQARASGGSTGES